MVWCPVLQPDRVIRPVPASDRAGSKVLISSSLDQKPFVRRRDFRDKVPDQGLLWQWRKVDHAFLQTNRAGIVDFPIYQHPEFLTCVGVDAGKSKCKRRIGLGPDCA